VGYMQHDAVIMTAASYQPGPDIERFRESIPEEFRHLVIGPVESVTNGYRHYVLLPDGSKEGWADSDTGDDIRERFIGLFSVRHDDGSSPQEGVHVTYGGDYEVEVGVSVDYLSGGEVDLSARASHNDQAHA
jgi:hypothetical protein